MYSEVPHPTTATRRPAGRKRGVVAAGVADRGGTPGLGLTGDLDARRGVVMWQAPPVVDFYGRRCSICIESCRFFATTGAIVLRSRRCSESARWTALLEMLAATVGSRSTPPPSGSASPPPPCAATSTSSPSSNCSCAPAAAPWPTACRTTCRCGTSCPAAPTRSGRSPPRRGLSAVGPGGVVGLNGGHHHHRGGAGAAPPGRGADADAPAHGGHQRPQHRPRAGRAAARQARADRRRRAPAVLRARRSARRCRCSRRLTLDMVDPRRRRRRASTAAPPPTTRARRRSTS